MGLRFGGEPGAPGRLVEAEVYAGEFCEGGQHGGVFDFVGDELCAAAAHVFSRAASLSVNKKAKTKASKRTTGGRQ